MTVSTLARSLPASAARRWRSLRRRTRVALVVLAVALPVVALAVFGNRPDAWPAKVSFPVSQHNIPLALSPDGRTLLTSNGSKIIPWDASSGEYDIPWTSPHGLWVRKGKFSPDGRIFAADNSMHPSDGTIELIDTLAGRSRASLALRNPIVHDLAFADGGRTLRAFLGDGTNLKEAATWDVATGQLTSSRPLTPPTKLSNTAFSPDGRLVALIPWQSASIQLWDLEADRLVGNLADPSWPGIFGPGIDFSHDGRTLAVARGGSGSIDVWDVPGRKLLKTFPVHPRGYASMQIRFSPDGRSLASSAREVGYRSTLTQYYHEFGRKFLGTKPQTGSELVIVDIADGRRIAQTSSSMFQFYSPDGRSLVTRESDLSVQIHDLPDRAEGKESPP